MGKSPSHASFIGLIRNLNTGYISRQFHVVYDNKFETLIGGYDENASLSDQIWSSLAVDGTKNTLQEAMLEQEPLPQLHDDWLTPDEIIQRQNADINLEVTRLINEQRGVHERDQDATRRGRDRHLRSMTPVKIVQDTQVSEEDNNTTTTEAMELISEEGQADITPRRSNRIAGHQPQYSGLICDEDILLQEICFFSSIDMQE